MQTITDLGDGVFELMNEDNESTRWNASISDAQLVIYTSEETDVFSEVDLQESELIPLCDET